MAAIGSSSEDIDFFRKILSESNAPVVITDALAFDRPIVFVNDAFERSTGYSAAESIGRDGHYLHGSKAQELAPPKSTKAIDNGIKCERVLRTYRKDGTSFWNHLHVYPIRNDNNVVTHLVSVHHDVTKIYEIVQNLFRSQNDPGIKQLCDNTTLDSHQRSEEIVRKVLEDLVKVTTTSPVQSEDRSSTVRPQDLIEHRMPALEVSDDLYWRMEGQAVTRELRRLNDRANTAAIATSRDTADKSSAATQAQPTHSKLSAVLNSITEGCLAFDHEWRFTYINDQAARWLGRRPEDLIGKNVWEELPEAVGGKPYQTYQGAMATRAYAQCDHYYPPAGRWLNARAYPSEEGLTIFFLDISERKRNEDRMTYAASHDHLTGLMNRETCLTRLERTLGSGTTRRGALAVLFVDLDRFKEINDALGHRAGDHLLRLLAQRFKALNTEWRYCARNSGDEFLFVLDPGDVVQAETFAKRLLRQIVEPFEVAGRRLTIGASIGIAVVAQDDVITASDLINHADTAMYAAKTSGRLAVRVFSPDSEAVTRQRHHLRTEMAAAINAGQFVLHYQPQVRLSDHRIEGVEALVRWNHPVYGLLSPAAFLDIAEESPLILALGAWVCNEACKQLAQWEALGHRLQIAINVSARQLVDSNFPALVLHTVQKHGLNPHSIELEITESMLAQDLQLAANVLKELADVGFQIALDDFGTGFSNLAYINRFPLTALKIDRSFVTNIDADSKAIELVKGIVAMAKSLKLSVICEGIETEEQRRALEITRCDIIQGYLISRPLPPDDLRKKFLDKHIATI